MVDAYVQSKLNKEGINVIIDLGYTIVETDYIESAVDLTGDPNPHNHGVDLHFISGKKVFVKCNTNERRYLAETVLSAKDFLDYIKEGMSNKSISLGPPAVSTREDLEKAFGETK